MRFHSLSREVLTQTLAAAGPGAPTLCSGWLSEELAAHLYLRERKARVVRTFFPSAQPHIASKAVQRIAEEARTPEGYTRLVERFRSRAASSAKPRVLRAYSDLIEYFVHTEDLRRARKRWAPRALDEDYSQALWHELTQRAAFLYRGVDLGIILVCPAGPRYVAQRATVSVAITGDPGELLMHAHGRTGHALVTFEGQTDAVALLKTAPIGP